MSAQQLSASCKLLGLFNESKINWEENKKTGKITADEIEDLISKRNLARSIKDFSTSDKIRDLLINKGVEISDQDGKTVWKYK